MWWLYPRAFCCAITTTCVYKFIKASIVFIAHVPEYIEYSIDDFSWSKFTEYPHRFLKTIRSEKRKLEEEHLSKKKEE